MTTGRQVGFWTAGLVVFVALLWLLRDVMLPFVAAMAVAYLLDPLADRLERGGAPRWLATTLVLLSFIVIAGVAIVLLFPLLRAQLGQLVEMVPVWRDWFQAEILPEVEAALRRISPDQLERLRTAAQDHAGTLVGWVGELVRGLLTGGVALVDVLSVVFITPIVAFYLLRDWDKFIAAIDGWLPLQHAAIIREQAREIDQTLAGFVRGQATVCLVLGTFYAIALSLAGLKFGLVVGLAAGGLSFIPFVGSLFGFLVSVGIALFQFDEVWRVGLVVAIFLFGQAVEGNVLTPKLVGERIGLHPVWVIFALMAAGSLMGFVGVLLAMPVAAVVGVLVRFGLKQYLASPFYTGPRRGPPPVDVFDGRPVHPAAESAVAHQPADTVQAP